MSEIEIENRWIRDYLLPRYPKLVDPYRETSSLSRKALEDGHLSEATLAVLERHAQDSRTVLSRHAASMLGRLSTRFESARSAVRRLASGPTVALRINALCALSEEDGITLHLEIVGAALRDKSAKVRLLAADKAMLWGLKELVSVLEAVVESEKDLKTTETLRRELYYLRDGYTAENRHDGVWLTVKVGGGLEGFLVTAEEFQLKGPATIAAERRAAKGHLSRLLSNSNLH